MKNLLLLNSEFALGAENINTVACAEWCNKDEIESKVNDWVLSKEKFVEAVHGVIWGVTCMDCDELSDMISSSLVDEKYLTNLCDNIVDEYEITDIEDLEELYGISNEFCRHAYRLELYAEQVEVAVNEFLIDAFVDELNKLVPNGVKHKYSKEYTVEYGTTSVYELNSQALNLVHLEDVMEEINGRVHSMAMKKFSKLLGNLDSVMWLTATTLVEVEDVLEGKVYKSFDFRTTTLNVSSKHSHYGSAPILEEFGDVERLSTDDIPYLLSVYEEFRDYEETADVD